MFNCDRPDFPDIVPFSETNFGRQVKQDGVSFVHGSNSRSLQGVALFRALLPMELINKVGWFHKDGLASGERGYVFEGLFETPDAKTTFFDLQQFEWQKLAPGRWHIPVLPVIRGDIAYVSKGVSLNRAKKASSSLLYADYGVDDKTGIFPILYGTTLRQDEVHDHPEHPVSMSAIPIDKISAIYVPEGKCEIAKAQLRELGLNHLSDGVKVGSCFSDSLRACSS